MILILNLSVGKTVVSFSQSISILRGFGMNRGETFCNIFDRRRTNAAADIAFQHRNVPICFSIFLLNV